MATTSEISKLLVLDFLTTEVSSKFSNKCRTKFDLGLDVKLPANYPTLIELVERFTDASKTEKKTMNGKKSGNKKRKYESSGSEEDLDADKSSAKKTKKNGQES